MRLSEAISLGATLRPQAFGGPYSGGGSCALSAATEAVGIEYFYCNKVWPYIRMSGFSCPECNTPLWNNDPTKPLTLGNVIADHLNDKHRWTRERIADWVAEKENELVAQGIDVEAKLDVTSSSSSASNQQTTEATGNVPVPVEA